MQLRAYWHRPMSDVCVFVRMCVCQRAVTARVHACAHHDTAWYCNSSHCARRRHPCRRSMSGASLSSCRARSTCTTRWPRANTTPARSKWCAATSLRPAPTWARSSPSVWLSLTRRCRFPTPMWSCASSPPLGSVLPPTSLPEHTSRLERARMVAILCSRSPASRVSLPLALYTRSRHMIPTILRGPT